MSYLYHVYSACIHIYYMCIASILFLYYRCVIFIIYSDYVCILHVYCKLYLHDSIWHVITVVFQGLQYHLTQIPDAHPIQPWLRNWKLRRHYMHFVLMEQPRLKKYVYDYDVCPFLGMYLQDLPVFLQNWCGQTPLVKQFLWWYHSTIVPLHSSHLRMNSLGLGTGGWYVGVRCQTMSFWRRWIGWIAKKEWYPVLQKSPRPVSWVSAMTWDVCVHSSCVMCMPLLSRMTERELAWFQRRKPDDIGLASLFLDFGWHRELIKVVAMYGLDLWSCPGACWPYILGLSWAPPSCLNAKV